MPASSEFIALCQAQVALLTDGLGAVLSIVYLTEELTEVSDTKLVPIAAYPDSVSHWNDDRVFALLAQGRRGNGSTQRLLASDNSESEHSLLASMPNPASDAEGASPLEAAETALLRQQQLVLPLMYQEVVMGLLVTARADRAWTDFEREQIEKIAETMAISCILDQRSQWVAQDLHQQRLLREQRHELLDDLLHQFRNPLTALRTFGKLLVKRLNPSDTNRTVAEGIVRESDRLQELLQQFNATIDLDDAAFRRLLTGDEIQDGELADADLTGQEFDLQDSLHAAASPQRPQSPHLLPGSTLLMGASLQRSPQTISEILLPLVDSAVMIAQDRQLTLRCEIPEYLPPIQIDPRALREVLNNLIDNALKYTPAGGQVYIGVQSVPSTEDASREAVQEPNLDADLGRNQQAIVIADTGPGIPQEDLLHLFERHYRGVQADTDIPGTGLGLTIARELVRQMQGEIQVFSPAHTCQLVPTELAPASSNAPTSPGTAIVVWLPEGD
ncbi:sensor histidine kinase [Egbenema bharatensis]|uniref:sensor histidine kinase n=1 Tax=Egbenema bharatensis TaxID=3463334 RepID=UPI003A8AF945